MRAALIGLGRIGWDFHLPELQRHRTFSLCAVADVNTNRLQEAKEKFGIQGYLDYREMLEKESPELVVIASPTIFHEEQAIESMRAGADVLLDKPMAIGYAAALRIAAVQRETGKKLVVYQPHRFSPETSLARRIIASGKLGEIYAMKCARCNFVRRNDWQAFREYGGGMLNNYGAHHIDQLLYLAGEKIDSVYCRTKKIASLGDADDVVKVVMQTETGKILDIDINQATAIPINPLMIFGSRGTASLEMVEEGEVLRIRYFEEADLEDTAVSKELAAANRTYPADRIPWKEELIPVTESDAVDFYAACESFFAADGESPVPLQETVYLMELIDRCHRVDRGDHRDFP